MDVIDLTDLSNPIDGNLNYERIGTNIYEDEECITDQSSLCQQTKHRQIYNSIPYVSIRRICRSSCHVCQKLGEVYSCCPFYRPSHQYCLNHFKQYIPQNTSHLPHIAKCPSCLHICQCNYCSLNPNDPRLLSSITTPMSDSEETVVTGEYSKLEEGKAHYRIAKSQPRHLSVRKLSEDTIIKHSSSSSSSSDDDNDEDNEVLEIKIKNNANPRKKPKVNESIKSMNNEMELSSSDNNNNNNNSEDLELIETANNNNITSNNDRIYYLIRNRHYRFKRMPISKSALIHGYDVTNGEYEALASDQHISKCIVCTDGGRLLLCDTCPLSYHENCLRNNDDVDRKWVCPNCVKMFSNPPFMLRKLQNHYVSPLFEACKDIIFLLFTLCDFQILHRESPDNDEYYQLINEPVFYEDVIYKFSSQIYTSVGDIYSDLQTIWDNCIAYFKATNSPRNLAKSECLAHFTKILWFSTLYKVNEK